MSINCKLIFANMRKIYKVLRKKFNILLKITKWRIRILRGLPIKWPRKPKRGSSMYTNSNPKSNNSRPNSMNLKKMSSKKIQMFKLISSRWATLFKSWKNKYRKNKKNCLTSRRKQKNSKSNGSNLISYENKALLWLRTNCSRAWKNMPKFVKG